MKGWPSSTVATLQAFANRLDTSPPIAEDEAKKMAKTLRRIADRAALEEVMTGKPVLPPVPDDD